MSESRVRIRQGDRELELEGDAAFVEAQLERLLPFTFGAGSSLTVAPVPAPHLEDHQVPANFAVKKNLSFEAFLELKQPSSDRDRLLVLAYYQEKYADLQAYPIADLAAAWTLAWPELPWDEACWKEAVEGGFLQWQEDGRLTLSFAGDQYVRDGLA
ncbi:hypothetical protein J7643_05670 [bacterium]|nr:hypothetical protein [bacterium]